MVSQRWPLATVESPRLALPRGEPTSNFPAKSKYNVLLAADVGYAPGMEFRGEDANRGGFRAGAMIGMYVPFIDFN